MKKNLIMFVMSVAIEAHVGTVHAQTETTPVPPTSPAPMSWRVDDDSSMQSVSLYRADSDATDALGLFHFDCVRHSGRVKVHIILSENDRADVGNMIKTNGYPKWLLIPDAGGGYEKISMNDADGWVLEFEVDAATKFFDTFAKTGKIQYQLFQKVRDYNFPLGKDVIPNFVKVCRK